jgi:predicted RNA binding protein YcfA (HicA-like mRNA interferase family)
MSCVVTITRDVPDSSDGLIAPDDWRGVIAEDDSLHEKTTDHPDVIVVQSMRAPSRHEVLFVFENGAISVTSPDDETLEKIIEDDGWVMVAQKGSHRQFKHPTKPGRVTIAGHAKDDLAPGTLNSILRQAGLKD